MPESNTNQTVFTAPSLSQIHFTCCSKALFSFPLFYCCLNKYPEKKLFCGPLKPSYLLGTAGWSWCRVHTHCTHSENGFSQHRNLISQEQCQCFTRTCSVNCFSGTYPCQRTSCEEFFLKPSVIVRL